MDIEDAVLIVFFALATVIVLFLFSWIYAGRCLALVPYRGYVTPCMVVNIHRYYYGPVATYGLELQYLVWLFDRAEQAGDLISIENGCPNCPRAYSRAPDAKQARADELPAVNVPAAMPA